MIVRTNDGWEQDSWGGVRFWGVPPHSSTITIWRELFSTGYRYRKPDLIGMPERKIEIPTISEGYGISIDDIVSCNQMTDVATLMFK